MPINALALTFEETRALLVSAVMVELQLVPGYVDNVAPCALPAHAAAIEKLRLACQLSHAQMDAMRADLVASTTGKEQRPNA